MITWDTKTMKKPFVCRNETFGVSFGPLVLWFHVFYIYFAR
jgi:hypothetical protein